MRMIRLLIEYAGTGFAGWQWQPNQRTIQGSIQDAIASFTGESVELIGAGRTDAGVHATGQVASFQTTSLHAIERFVPGINFHLPAEIRIRRAEEAAPDFHARFSAVWRQYRYLVQTVPSVFHQTTRWQTKLPVQLPLLHAAAAALIGTHDFAPFCVTASLKESNECTVYAARWRQIGPLLSFDIRANRFLHAMVRSLVGSMYNLAQSTSDRNPNNLTLEKFTHMLHHPAGERSVFTAPAHGLYLMAVGYNEEGRPT